MIGPRIYQNDFLTLDQDDTLVAEYLTRIVSTSPGELVNNPNFGSKVKGYLFNYSGSIKQDIERELNNIFKFYLSGYVMKDFSLSEDEHALTLELTISKTVTQEVFAFSQTFVLLEKKA